MCVCALSSIRISIVGFDRNARSGSIGKDRANRGGSCNPALDKFIGLLEHTQAKKSA